MLSPPAWSWVSVSEIVPATVPVDASAGGVEVHSHGAKERAPLLVFGQHHADGTGMRGHAARGHFGEQQLLLLGMVAAVGEIAEESRAFSKKARSKRSSRNNLPTLLPHAWSRLGTRY